MSTQEKEGHLKPKRKVSKGPILLICPLGFAASRIGEINSCDLSLSDCGFPIAALPTNIGFLEKGP